MKFRHLLIFALFATFIVSCSKNKGDNFSFIPDAADTSGTGSATTPVTIPVGNDAPPTSGEDSNNFLGNPTPASTDVVVNKDDYLINQGYYVESYSSTRETPNWVCWHLDKTSIGGTKRSDAFAAYAGLPSAFFAVQSDSYNYATYGFDRGHDCPSADRTSSLTANKATFLMTNMIPQAPQNNQQTWGNLEDYIRTQVNSNGMEAYIIMGSYGTGGTGLYGTFSTIKYSKYTNEAVNVPSYVWKVAILIPSSTGDLSRITASSKIIAVNTPNINSINADWTQYITTVNAIEAASNASTGATAGQKINLFGALPADVKAALKAKTGDGK
ncbi:endonuclease G [Mucilaginibacter gracilis]|uniref:Endonuclease G n=1 Tax=Mucilaginibacter gracilis TaxID=423350 RepID=A0A495J8S7_9SPHI|nr:DNA/RNA non-specific endonuclease [Mucilaginibacter gracilis]RKR84449.1 endonuclease G [Mucilaginibacter gracilis]